MGQILNLFLDQCFPGERFSRQCISSWPGSQSKRMRDAHRRSSEVTKILNWQSYFLCLSEFVPVFWCLLDETLLQLIYLPIPFWMFVTCHVLFNVHVHSCVLSEIWIVCTCPKYIGISLSLDSKNLFFFCRFHVKDSKVGPYFHESAWHCILLIFWDFADTTSFVLSLNNIGRIFVFSSMDLIINFSVDEGEMKLLIVNWIIYTVEENNDKIKQKKNKNF